MKIFSIVFSFLIILFCESEINAKVEVSALSNETNLLKTLKKYKVHMNFCDEYIDRYAVIKNIEYYNFDGFLLKNGIIIVNDALAENVINIFNELKKIKFPIANINPKMGRKIKPLLFFGFFGFKKVETDEKLAENFTGSYSCRKIENTNKLSLHSFGTAIDINILQNPCIFIDDKKKKIISIVPKDGIFYLNRKITRPNKPYGKGKVNDEIVSIFRKYGFDVWGGNWDYPIDYQHFQVSDRNFSNLLMTVNKSDAKKIFNQHVECLKSNDKSLSELADENNIFLEKEYINDKTKDKSVFFDLIKNICQKSKNVKQFL